MTSLETEKLYDREGAARKLEMSLATFDRLRHAGKIEEIRLSPHKVRFTEEALGQYVADQTKPRSAVNSLDCIDGESENEPGAN